MKSANLRTRLTVSGILALTAAFAPAGHANVWTTVNPDGTVTRTEVTVPAGAATTSTTPATTQALPKTSNYYGGNLPTASNGTLLGGSSCIAGYPSYPGYYPAVPGYYGTYTAPVPIYSAPIGQPQGFAPPWITGFGGTTTYGYYGPAPCAPAYPPVGYPTAGRPCPAPAPAYGYPVPTYPYPTYPYSTYPGTFGGTTTRGITQGSTSFRSGGLSMTFGGSRVRSNFNSNTYNNFTDTYTHNR